MLERLGARGSSAPDCADGIRMLEEIPILLGVVFDARAVEPRGGHRVERDADAVDRDDLIAVDRLGSVAEAVAAAAAAGGEGDAQDAAVEIVLQVLSGGRGELDVHSGRDPWTMRNSASSRLNQSRSSFSNSSSRSSSTMCAFFVAAR